MRISFRFGLSVCALIVGAYSAHGALVHQWNLDEGGGTVVSPEVGTISGSCYGSGLVWKSGGPPTTYLPDATQVTVNAHLATGGTKYDYVNFGNAASLAPANLTVAFWAKGIPGTGYLDKVLFSKHGNSEEASSWEFGFSNNAVSKQAFFKVWTESGVYSANDATGFTIDDFLDAQWHHFVGIYDGSNVTLMIDGREIASVPATGSVSTTSDLLYLGGRPFVGDSNQTKWAAKYEAGGPILIFDEAIGGLQAAGLGGFQYQPLNPYTPPEPALVGRWDLAAIEGGVTPVVVGPRDGSVRGNVALTAGGPPEITLPGGATIASENHLAMGGGSGDYVHLGADAALCPGELTVGIWVQATGLHSNQVFLSKHGQGGSSFELGIHGAGQMLEFRCWTDDGTEVRAGKTAADPFMNTDLNDGQWHLIVGTHSLEETCLYVDGNLIEAIADTGTVAQTITELLVGRRPYGGAECPFSGNIGGPLLIFNYALSATEIAALLGGGGPELDGDLNGDGMVSSFDLDVVRSNWGRTDLPPGSLSQGDTNGDGKVNSGDLDIVRANWGRTLAAAAVPEPGLVSLSLAVGLLAAALRRRHP